MASINIAIPCYQHGRFLRECVASVLTQGIADIRILIIDNASTDGSVEVARQLAAEDARVDVVAHRTNLGPQASFNEGVDWAASDYFMVLCADDMLAPGCLRRAVAVMERHRGVTVALGTDIEFRDGEKPQVPPADVSAAPWRVLTGSEFIADRCRRPASYIAAGSALVRTSAQKRAGYYRPELPYTNDQEMLLRLARLGSVAETAAVQGLRRLHGSNMSELFRRTRTDELAHRAAAFESFFAREGHTMPEARRLARLAKRRLAARAYWWGARALLSNDLSGAIRLLGYAFRSRPISVVLPPVGFLFARR